MENNVNDNIDQIRLLSIESEERRLCSTFRRNVRYFGDYYDDQPTKILDNLYLGNVFHTILPKSVEKYKFDYIFNIGVHINQQDFIIETPSHFIDIQDRCDSDILEHLEDLTTRIHLKLHDSKKVYVHCYVGMSRSSTVIAAYLIKYHNMTVLEAVEDLKRLRPIVQPNAGFMQQLESFYISRQKILSTNVE